jgi:hypothetical protein
MGVHMEFPTRAELEADRDEILAAYPRLAEVVDHCCGGCAETHAADLYGWRLGAPAFERLEQIRYLLGDDE